MGKFDLNNAADFARATNSFGANILQSIQASGAQDWIIDEAKYKSGRNPSVQMIFHIFRSQADFGGAVSRVSDSGGRRKAKFEFPFMDGQLTNDMGREGETFSLAVLLYGNNYKAAYNKLMNILNEPTPGILTHPVRGEITCAMEHYECIHEDAARKAVAIQLTMIEHSIQALQLGKAPDKTAPSLLSKLSQSFAKIESAINKVQGAVWLVQSIKNQIKLQLENYQNAYAKVAGNMNRTFNPGGNIPALLPTQAGGLLNSSGQIVSNSTTIAVSPNDPLQGLPLALLNTSIQQALAVDQIQKAIAATRDQVTTLIESLQAAGGGRGSLDFSQNVLDMRVTANDLQAAFEAGKQSSQVRIIDYVVPRVMSIRELAFANGIAPDESNQIALLNPGLESLNYIPKDAVIKVALS